VVLVAPHPMPERLAKDLEEVLGPHRPSSVRRYVIDVPRDPDPLLALGLVRELGAVLDSCSDGAAVAISSLLLNPLNLWVVGSVCEARGLHAYLAMVRKAGDEEVLEAVEEGRVFKFCGEPYVYEGLYDDWGLVVVPSLRGWDGGLEPA